MPATLEQAIAVVRAFYGEQRWLLLDPAEQTRAIYREIRRLDLEETMARRALARSAEGMGQAIVQHHTDVVRAADPASVAEPLRCSAFIKTRAGDRCTWQPVVVHEGKPYCGFHNPLRQRASRGHMTSGTHAGDGNTFVGTARV